MEIFGEKIFAKDAEGRLLSRVGTLFFKHPAIVTRRGIHAMQRAMWLEEINRRQAAAGLQPLTPQEEEEELAQSVDLIFTDDTVLIRPDPERMDLALRADELLCALVTKLRVRYLNTSAAKVRNALCERGENWRMARHPISQEDMAELIKSARVAIDCLPIYHYNGATGTRFLTNGSYLEVSKLGAEDFRRQLREIVAGLNRRNRLGQPEVDIFPVTTPVEIRSAFKALKVDELDDDALRAATDAISRDWRLSLPAELREETVDNYEWRNTMAHTITRRPNETVAEEQELVSGIAPEFYRQIEWLPGARIDRGEVIFDELWDAAERTRAPELLALCDSRVKSLIFNITRLFGGLDFINVGRIARSLARRPVKGARRGNVYIVQYRECGSSAPKILMIRFQKWGVAEHLDEGKDLMRSILESDEYSDYILDRLLMCRQLGMHLPKRIGYGHFTEKYRGDNQYNGVAVRTAYFVRPYVRGLATDKVPPPKFRNPAFALRFAKLLGEAAAIDLIVGRRASETGELVFDGNFEIILPGADGLPDTLMVTDQAGSFVDYERPLAESVEAYALVTRRRRAFVGDYPAFATAFAEAFREQFLATQAAYRERRAAFDGLFKDRPFDTNGSGSYRWACVLRRLDESDAEALYRQLLAAALETKPEAGGGK